MQVVSEAAIWDENIVNWRGDHDSSSRYVGKKIEATWIYIRNKDSLLMLWIDKYLFSSI
jgi:hypothetical protein